MHTEVNPGWIRLHRQLLQHPIFRSNDERQLKFWLMLLLTANYAEGRMYIKSQEIIVKPGQILTSISGLVEMYNRGENNKLIPKEYRISVQGVRTLMQRFTSWSMLRVDSTNNYSLITIENWDMYQQNSTSNQHATNKQPTNLYIDKEEVRRIKKKEVKEKVVSKYPTFESIDAELIKATAIKYRISTSDVKRVMDELEDSQKTYTDYSKALRTYVRNAINWGKLKQEEDYADRIK